MPSKETIASFSKRLKAIIRLWWHAGTRVVALMAGSSAGPVINQISESFSAVAAALALAITIIAIALAVLGYARGKRGQEELEQKLIAEGILEQASASTSPSEPFEITALAQYYKQALSRASISFWFSIIFASIGFSFILFAFASYTADDIAGTVLKVAGGTIIDAISILFFVQSTNAQRSMSDFFEKLRLDRLNAEAREMIAEIENAPMRDQLRSQLILKYSGIDKLLDGSR